MTSFKAKLILNSFLVVVSLTCFGDVLIFGGLGVFTSVHVDILIAVGGLALVFAIALSGDTVREIDDLRNRINKLEEMERKRVS